MRNSCRAHLPPNTVQNLKWLPTTIEIALSAEKAQNTLAFCVISQFVLSVQHQKKMKKPKGGSQESLWVTALTAPCMIIETKSEELLGQAGEYLHNPLLACTLILA